MKWLIIACFSALASCGGSSNVTSLDENSSQLNDGPQGVANDGSPTTTEPPSATPTINRDNHDAIIGEVFKVYSGRAFDAQLTSLASLPDQFGPIIADDIDETTYSCDNGGTVSVSIIEDFSFFRTSYSYSDCQVGDRVLNGDFRVIESEEETLRSSQNGLSIEINSDTNIEFSGLAAFSCCLSSIWYVRTNELNYSYSSPAERFTIVGSTSRFADGENFQIDAREASLTGDFQIETPVSGFERLTVSVVNDFAYRSESDLPDAEFNLLASTWMFSSGRLRVVAEDGSELVLDAESGDLSTARISIENSDGTEEFDQPWSLWMGVLNVADR